MGQKVNPIGMRVTVNKNWRSRWYAEKKEYGKLLLEDLAIRDFIKNRFKDAAVADIYIERYMNRVQVTILAGRPGMIQGRKGVELEKLREELSTRYGKEVRVAVREIKQPDLNAQLVAEGIAWQLERRVSFRRAMKRAVQMAMEHGAKGIKVQVAGRLGGAELARTEWYREGSVPLQTFSANVDYGFAEAHTVAGKIGVKVWICLREGAQAEEGKAHAAYA